MINKKPIKDNANNMPCENTMAMPYSNNQMPCENAMAMPYPNNQMPYENAMAMTYPNNQMPYENTMAMPYQNNQMPYENTMEMPYQSNQMPYQNVMAMPYENNNMPCENTMAMPYQYNQMSAVPQTNSPMMQPNYPMMPMQPIYYPMMTKSEEELEKMYPKTYDIINPAVENQCNKMEMKKGVMGTISKEQIDEMCENILKDVEGDVEKVLDTEIKGDKRQLGFGGRFVLSDLVRILLLRELIRRRRPFGYPGYGFPGYYGF